MVFGRQGAFSWGWLHFVLFCLIAVWTGALNILELVDETVFAHFAREKYTIFWKNPLKKKRGTKNPPLPPYIVTLLKKLPL